MADTCKFGIELPCFAADDFLSKPEQYYSLRLMPPGTNVPRTRHGSEIMGQRIKEIGFEFAGYDLRPHDLEAAVSAARWAKKHGISFALNNPACQIHGEPTPGFNTWVYPPELLEKVKAEVELIGVIYDEMNHHQLHPGFTGHTNPWNSLADVSECDNAEEAYKLVEGAYKKVFAHTVKTAVPSLIEDVFPVLFHASARTGGYPGCKVLKEQNTPLTLSICMSAAHQYRVPWYATIDLWEGDSGPWYQIVSRNSGHNPKEFMSALKLMALLNPYAAMVESCDLLWVVDSKNADLTEFGEVAKQFFKDIRPEIKPAFDVRSWSPTVAIVHCEDGNFQIPRTTGSEFEDAFWVNSSRMLLGGQKIKNTMASAKWLKAWYHLTWGKCSGNTLHNYFNPLELEIARKFDVGGTEHEIESAPSLEKRRDPKRTETHMHSLFTPLNNVAVFDGYVKSEQLNSAGLIILCGSYCTQEAQQAVIKAVQEGARCICQEECSPIELKNVSGQKVGNGYWWTVPDFNHKDAIEQLFMYRGYQNQWTLLSDLGLLRIYPKDPWGNEIEWEVEQNLKGCVKNEH